MNLPLPYPTKPDDYSFHKRLMWCHFQPVVRHKLAVAKYAFVKLHYLIRAPLLKENPLPYDLCIGQHYYIKKHGLSSSNALWLCIGQHYYVKKHSLSSSNAHLILKSFVRFVYIRAVHCDTLNPRVGSNIFRAYFRKKSRVRYIKNGTIFLI